MTKVIRTDPSSQGAPPHWNDLTPQQREAYINQDYVHLRETPMSPSEISRRYERYHQDCLAATSRIFKRVARELTLSVLTKRQRFCIKAYFWQGLSQPRIAEILGTTQPAVSDAIRRGMLRLKEQLRTKLSQKPELEKAYHMLFEELSDSHFQLTPHPPADKSILRMQGRAPRNPLPECPPSTLLSSFLRTEKYYD